ncbi:6-phosphofructokinase [Rubellicoccus peritrichatus]|uniref:Pyrophosphate--fructose 6-phosphate 1-phosphotransferase n=1 Tax=Rubellicoccus peritrichatus TaxID=3080537 RepID=A0AAQ3LD30_9BACT|nr:6-phosphofructokinase [Puniceicoccus sp. CR14]WOO42262.1 6-phosphofructokinase [Puniceicoccus sp. CR14]
MSEELSGNVLVAQSGGPTTVINASLAGVVTEALNHGCIEEIYGGLNGIQGILTEDLVDLAEESQQVIRGLRYTPAAALGTCRYKVKRSEDFDRILEVFKAHNIRYFFYIGGNDSQDTADQISKLAQERNYELRVIGIPKTVDNDLPVTDHCPGYGSVVKYISTTIKEMALDHEAVGQHDFVSIVEVMGRNAGWIAAGATMAKRRNQPEDPPHIILLPEIAFDSERFLYLVQESLKKNRYCMVVVGEGLVDTDGNYVAAASQADSFGHAPLGGAAEYLRQLVEQRLGGVRVRANKLGIAQRSAAHCSSQADNDEAYMCGVAAVEAAIAGESDKMVTLVRTESEQYGCETGLTPLSGIANQVKPLPATWINEDGVSLSFQFHKYASPLIQGEVEVPFENGIPEFVTISGNQIAKELAPYQLG